MTPDLERLNELYEKAERGDWAVDPDDRPGMHWNNQIVRADDPNMAICFMAHDSTPENVIGQANAELIAALHNAWPALYAQLRQREGWVRNPTDDMIEAGMEKSLLGRPFVDDDSYVLGIYRAMIAAAPNPPIAQEAPKVDPWRALADKAVGVLQRHIIPDGSLSDHDALSELYGIFDGPEYRAAIAQEPPHAQAATAVSGDAAAHECHGLDTPERVCFYEHDFYVLSNFSAFRLRWGGIDFDTSEHAYHWEKFCVQRPDVAHLIRTAPSAHEAFKCAEEWRDVRCPEWDDIKVDTMRRILREKARQHEYVRRKLLATGDRELVENSWRDDFWGWGPKRDGQNMLGKLWMEVRAEFRRQGHG